MIYEEIFREFGLRDVCYLVVGGMAVNLYGYVKLTMGLDIMVDPSDVPQEFIIDWLEEAIIFVWEAKSNSGNGLKLHS